MDAKFYEQEHAQIYGHNVWHYLIDTTIGSIHIVQVEGKNMMIHEDIVRWDNQKAEKLFKRRCQELLNGKYL